MVCRHGIERSERWCSSCDKRHITKHTQLDQLLRMLTDAGIRWTQTETAQDSEAGQNIEIQL